MSDSFDPKDCSMPGLAVHCQLLEFMQTHVHWVGDVIQPSHPLLSPSPPAFSLSQHTGLFQWVWSFPVSRLFQWPFCIRWSKNWSFSLSISPSNEYSRLISFRIDWFDLLAVKGTLRSLLPNHSWKASILQHSIWIYLVLINLYHLLGLCHSLKFVLYLLPVSSARNNI